jgi:bifunctional UDP-N-acetylglucosamine pyrophosphorylase/glucosamine-1-phosphate N-acetyltransferase
MNSDLPKVLQLLAGKPLLQHVIDAARRLAPADLYVVYGHGGARVQAAFAHEHLDWVLQAEQLGTGHAVMQAMSLIPDDHTVLVLYGDVPLVGAASLRELVHRGAAGALALLTVRLEDATGDQLAISEANSGLMAAPAGRLRDWLLGLGVNNAQREYYLTDVVARAVQSQTPVAAIPVARPVEVLGVNDRVQLAEAEAGYRAARARDLMMAGATLADPLRIDIRGEISVDRDVFIDVGVVLVGRVHLGARVQVGPYCVIRDSRLAADTEVRAHCVIEDAVVGENCRIGPFARLRPGTGLGPDVHVGNFVEIKKTSVGPGSKVNHLSYLGDATVGAGVNVGAGTITCNYDGVNKSETVIEDGAFIGSGSMLVAPVRIGSGATIGAGSTITQPAPDEKLTLARARQVTVEKWSRPPKKP